MADRAYMIPLRNDLNGTGLYVYDLKPDGSQKNNVLDGVGQSHYLKYAFGVEADDQVYNAAEGLVSGSTTQDTFAAVAVADVAGGGNDTFLTQATEVGLKAYLRERVHVNPGGNDDSLTQGEVDLLYDDIVAGFGTGVDVDLAFLNAALVARAGANTDLDGAAAGSDSFGTVEDIVRILSGEVYRVRDNTCITDNASVFLSLADRQARVAANVLAFDVYAQGGFLTAGEVGYRAMPQLALTEAVRLSANSGVLAAFGAATGIAVNNPSFTYVGGTPTAIRPWAENPFNNAIILANHIAPVCFVYDHNGNRIS